MRRIIELCPHLWGDAHRISGEGDNFCTGGAPPSDARLIEECRSRGLIGDDGTVTIPTPTNDENQQEFDSVVYAPGFTTSPVDGTVQPQRKEVT